MVIEVSHGILGNDTVNIGPQLLCHHERRTLGGIDDVIGKVNSTYTLTLPLQ
jgi:rRNA processing protein Gar1